VRSYGLLIVAAAVAVAGAIGVATSPACSIQGICDATQADYCCADEHFCDFHCNPPGEAPLDGCGVPHACRTSCGENEACLADPRSAGHYVCNCAPLDRAIVCKGQCGTVYDNCGNPINCGDGTDAGPDGGVVPCATTDAGDLAPTCIPDGTGLDGGPTAFVCGARQCGLARAADGGTQLNNCGQVVVCGNCAGADTCRPDGRCCSGKEVACGVQKCGTATDDCGETFACGPDCYDEAGAPTVVSVLWPDGGTPCYGHLVDPYTWESSQPGDDWLAYQGERAWRLHMVDRVTGLRLQGIPFTQEISISASPTPQAGGGTEVPVAGNLAEYHLWCVPGDTHCICGDGPAAPDGAPYCAGNPAADPPQLDVTNDSCSEYAVRVVMHATPFRDAGTVTDAGIDAPADAPIDSPSDAPSDTGGD